jgi:hypothetical protein
MTKKGITVLDLSNDTIDFIPNTYSPIFKKVKVISEGDIEKLDELSNSKDYIDISISNSLSYKQPKT